ncbi:3-phenylpropionate/cinnamic acid dioxygenase small subunit [Rhodococcus fascians]|uniref:nuclear transport factor 2 family protein n=1 Tax=Nocardiaceae TaxID=85025 RepID=UPI00285B92C1|nr:MULTISPECIES: nuclear transport factor 2 family protein [Rhodococcus]MDR6910103.1 3-phenylpropionate/cinnamic acid dioxygenase small subunit [Rhodococcus sp. 3258]MDR6931251.1 3-phenylpropionate/cinnamic acid dioxygenase small subunit [Rhodococcus fascians]
MTLFDQTVTPELHQELVQLTVKMGWYLDHKQWELMDELFTDRVRLDYTGLNGGDVAVVDRAAMVEKWAKNREPLTSTQHLISNHLVSRLSDDSATATAMFQATHLKPNDQGGPLWTLGGEYEYTFSSSNSGWRISGLAMRIIWADGNRNIRDLP